MTATIIGNIKDFWHNKQHYKIQVFGLGVLMAVLVFAANLLGIIARDHRLTKEFQAANVFYSGDIMTSLSGVQGTMSRVYVNNDKTQAFVVLRMNNMTALSVNAADYEVFLTDCDFEGHVKGTPKKYMDVKADIYVFGYTGCIGVYIESEKPFRSVLERMTLRCNNSATNTSGDVYVNYDVTDSYCDQLHCYFNLGASEAETIDFLEAHVPGTQFDPTLIYQQAYVADEEKADRQAILDQYVLLHDLMSDINYYITRLEDDHHVAIGDLPEDVGSDYFTNIDVTDADGNVYASYERFIPGTVYPCGTDFDWYRGGVVNGYFKYVPESRRQDMTFKEYLKTLRSTEPEPLTTLDQTFYYEDGTELDPENIAYDAEVKAVIKDYYSTLNKYRNAKAKYQTELLPALLWLEYDSTNAVSFYTVNDTDENRYHIV